MLAKPKTEMNLFIELLGKHTEWHCPSWPDTIVTLHVSYFMTGGPGKEHRTNKPLPTGRVSVQFSRSVVSDSLRPHESQPARPPCPSPTPGVHPNSRASSRWCHPAISSSVIPFSSCLQSPPASGSFQMRQLQMIKILEFQLQHQSFQWIFRTDFL